ncbi:uncharacterized protein LOC106670818 [Cimex lectularius]|uniref:Uncharacterized protein n=1 Tax=Cimex lectularius TaxID=79782 RepID=A0A8I6S6T4_CIMLE|nr:uncharacterized protein LOC106670818 [Cimex lectularius]
MEVQSVCFLDLPFRMRVGTMFLFFCIFGWGNGLVTADTTVCPCTSPNVRTVLFRNADCFKECWNNDEIILLYSRRLFQAVLPKRMPVRTSFLIKYIKLCLGVIKKMELSKRVHYLMMSAMADVFGGYLQAFGIPLAIAEYYEGANSYHETKQADELLTEFKKLLSTNGGSWTKQIYIKRSNHVTPYIVESPIKKNLCSTIVTNNEYLSFRKIKQKSVTIAMPYLDDAQHPSAIAIPLKDKTLYSLFTNKSSDILLRYYSGVTHCLLSPNDLNKDIICATSPSLHTFNLNFHKWLISEIYPHLHDETWYPGFGSVFRLFETLSLKGFPKPFESVNETEITSPTLACRKTTTSNSFFILCVITFVIMFWLITWVVYFLLGAS